MKIQTVIKQPGHKPAVMLMDNSLESFQRFVEGNIETVTFWPDFVAICNEEGRLLGMKKNMKFIGVDFVGPVVFVGIDGDELCGLTEDQTQRIMDMIK